MDTRKSPYTKILEYLDKKYNEGIRQIFIETLSQDTSISVDRLLTIIPEFLKDGHLSVRFEIRCPTCNENHGSYNRMSDIPLKNIFCEDCDTSFYTLSQEVIDVSLLVSERLGGAAAKPFFRPLVKPPRFNAPPSPL